MANRVKKWSKPVDHLQSSSPRCASIQSAKQRHIVRSKTVIEQYITDGALVRTGRVDDLPEKALRQPRVVLDRKQTVTPDLDSLIAD